MSAFTNVNAHEPAKMFVTNFNFGTLIKNGSPEAQCIPGRKKYYRHCLRKHVESSALKDVGLLPTVLQQYEAGGLGSTSNHEGDSHPTGTQIHEQQALLLACVSTMQPVLLGRTSKEVRWKVESMA